MPQTPPRLTPPAIPGVNNVASGVSAAHAAVPINLQERGFDSNGKFSSRKFQEQVISPSRIADNRKRAELKIALWDLETQYPTAFDEFVETIRTTREELNEGFLTSVIDQHIKKGQAQKQEKREQERKAIEEKANTEEKANLEIRNGVGRVTYGTAAVIFSAPGAIIEGLTETLNPILDEILPNAAAIKAVREIVTVLTKIPGLLIDSVINLGTEKLFGAKAETKTTTPATKSQAQPEPTAQDLARKAALDRKKQAREYDIAEGGSGSFVDMISSPDNSKNR